MADQHPLQKILDTFRKSSKTEREKGTYFEELICAYLRNEPTYEDLYSDVWMLADVPEKFGINKTDVGVDLVARTHGTGEFHAIQCKCYDEAHQINKEDIDSFFTASGKKPFSHRVIVTTTDKWGVNAVDALEGQQPPVNVINLADLRASQIDWAKYVPNEKPALKKKYDPEPHQETAISHVINGLKHADRGKMIMACGTGKTFVALKIAEEQAGKNKRVLFLVPSLALLSQTLTEWTQQSKTPLHSFAVCSDSAVGKKRKKDDDVVRTFVHELQFPATTEADRLADEMEKRHDSKHMSVVFATYHSISVVHDAQKKHGLKEFDLIICDEAHRTTGATFDGEAESHFVKVHDQGYIKGKKRLYMTATPRIYGESAKARAEQEDVEICSMDDESLYGKQLFILSFSEAVERGLLVDYKVVVLTIEEDYVSQRMQTLLADGSNQLKVDDAARIIGCWKALAKQGFSDDKIGTSEPMKRAVAFCQVIDPVTGKTSHKVSSKHISNMFQQVVDAYHESVDEDDPLLCESRHVDGTMNATEKTTHIEWLKEPADDNTCRILSNVRCLSEGVDVPALDAVLFLSPRNSPVEVVQSVGRVMRKPRDGTVKKLGYVVLPVVIPHGVKPHESLDDNKIYKVVWEVLQALRSHDDRFDAFANKLDLISDPSGRMEVIAVTDKLGKKSSSKDKVAGGRGDYTIGTEAPPHQTQRKFQFEPGELEKALYAKLVQKCGTRNYWESWASDIADIALTHISRITAIVENQKNTKEIKAFNSFAGELRDDLNDSISDGEVIEMLAQHLITKPVFDALFEEYSFASNNSVSKGMQKILDLLHEHHLEKETATLENFYGSVRRRASGIDTAEGKQKIVVELYDKFFRNAFPRLTERLGIVYTPVEVVDFIIHSVNDVLQEEFGQTLADDGVHILDPFVGTGTFITRLLQSGLIPKDKLPNKYRNEIHCNEIILLAYYIAAINIEAVYHSIVGGGYKPYEGILLTDTFQMYESDDQIEQFFPDNSERRKRQKKLPIRIIFGNPPYASADRDETGVKATSYAELDRRIAATYVASAARQMGKSKMYDSYIRAIRWASDRIGESGIIGFVTNAGYLDANTFDGLRKCLAEEFCGIYVFNLRGDARTSGEQRRKEKDNVFGQGTRTPVAISILVKKSKKNSSNQIFYHEVGDYLTREQKLSILADLKSISGIKSSKKWTAITPDVHHDWLNQRDTSFDDFIPIGNKKTRDISVFSTYSMGVKSNRDDWVYNSSEDVLQKQLKSTIDFYNSESERVQSNHSDASALDRNPKKIKWTSDLIRDATSGIDHTFDSTALRQSMYRPFFKQWSYFDPSWNWTRHLMHEYFPTNETNNLSICVTGLGESKPFSALITNLTPNLHLIAGAQCYPLAHFDNCDDKKKLFLSTADHKNDAIRDAGLDYFIEAYGGAESISKEDLFYYIYSLLHSQEYRERYKDNLSKELPRIPAVRKFEDFKKFSQAGRDLAHWHLNYETVDCHPVTLEFTAGNKGPQSLKACKDKHFYVKKMKFGKTKDPDQKKNINDKTTVIYNDFITVKDIPLEAYGYVVNGKPAIEWVMERQAVTTDRKSGIVNDANLWATETMGNAAYPLELLQRVITVSLETNRIVDSLPALDID
ncbi:DEAD/DEAH box helicase family protein [bacterium]|nr:DEAD/DEAH box helicase family protein [bacterium]